METTELWTIRRYAFIHHGGRGFELIGPSRSEVWMDEDGQICWGCIPYLHVPKDVKRRIETTVHRVTGM